MSERAHLWERKSSDIQKADVPKTKPGKSRQHVASAFPSVPQRAFLLGGGTNERGTAVKQEILVAED